MDEKLGFRQRCPHKDSRPVYGETGEVSAEDFDPNGPWSWTSSGLPQRGRASWETWHQTHGESRKPRLQTLGAWTPWRQAAHWTRKLKQRRSRRLWTARSRTEWSKTFFVFLSFLIVLTDIGVVAHVTVTTKLPVLERLSCGRNIHRASVTGDASSSQETSTATHFQESEDAFQLASGKSMLHTLSCGTKKHHLHDLFGKTRLHEFS